MVLRYHVGDTVRCRNLTHEDKDISASGVVVEFSMTSEDESSRFYIVECKGLFTAAMHWTSMSSERQVLVEKLSYHFKR